MSIVLELPRELEERLDALLEDTGKTKEECLLTALEQYIEDLEDYEDAVRIAALIDSGQMETYTLEEAGRCLGLED